MATEKIPVFKPLIEQEELDAARAALELGWLGMGSYVGQFEQAIKNYVSSDSGITQGVQVKNIKIEGIFASASVSAEGAESAMVFMKKPLRISVF